jgi:hypothetical protein
MTTDQITNDNNEDVVSALKAMRRQEDDVYNLALLYQNKDDPYRHGGCVDTLCRSKMITWCYEIMESYCKFNRELVEISSRNLDRFILLRSPEILNDTDTFQLASITCFYTTVKIHQSKAIQLRVISKICRGKFTEKDIMSMELKILHTLSWQIHPPTATGFMLRLMVLISSDIMNEVERKITIDLAKFQIEYGILIPSLIGTKASTIAIAALINAMALINIQSDRIEWISILWKKIADFRCNSVHLLEVQRLMYVNMHL